MNVQASSLTSSVIQEQLIRILASRTFCRAGFLRRFLELCVSETLKGHGGQLKEMWLGGEVFGRRDDFNPGIDPIVRVQARRLREKLTLYYRVEGGNDRTKITLPVGSYTPVFSITTARERTAGLLGRSSIAIAILPLEPSDEESSSIQVSEAITMELADALVNLGTLKVVPQASSLEADFFVAGTVRCGASSHRISIEVRETQTDNHYWSAWFEQRSTRFFPDVQQVAQMLREELCPQRETLAAGLEGIQTTRN